MIQRTVEYCTIILEDRYAVYLYCVAMPVPREYAPGGDLRPLSWTHSLPSIYSDLPVLFSLKSESECKY